MVGAVIFIAIVVFIPGGLLFLRTRSHRRWMRMTPEERDQVPTGRVPWPILSVAAFALALYEAVSRHAPALAVGLISFFAAVQILFLVLWLFALWHNRRLARAAASD
jgi:hypothetical protein